MLRLPSLLFLSTVAVFVVSTLLLLSASSSPISSLISALSLEQMYADSTHVWSGVVTEVDYKDHDQEGFINWRNRHYRLTVNVTGVAKNRGRQEKAAYHHRHEETERKLRHHAENLPPHEGEGSAEHPDHVFDEFHDDESINVGELVHVHFWKALSRPPGYNLPNSPGTKGLEDRDHLLEVGKELAFFGEYLQRDQARRFMYHSTHPGQIRRRKHTGSKSVSMSKSEEAVENNNGNGNNNNDQQQQQEEFSFINGYIAYVPDGVSEDVSGVFEAVKSFEEDRKSATSKKADL